MVSNASVDFPDPDRPVKTISVSRGSSSETLRRLCSRAPRITSLSDTPPRLSASGRNDDGLPVRPTHGDGPFDLVAGGPQVLGRRVPGNQCELLDSRGAERTHVAR